MKTIFAVLCLSLLTSCTCAGTRPTTEEEERRETIREFHMNRLDRIP